MADDEAPTDDAILSRALELQALDEAAEDRATEREAQAEARNEERGRRTPCTNARRNTTGQ